jgi:hypothetical protein
MELKKSLREIFLMGTSHPSPSPCQPITSRCPHIRKTLVRQAPHCRPWRQKDGGRVIGSSSGSHHACLCAATAESTNMSMEVARAYSELGELVQGPDVFTLRYTHRPETRRLRASSYRICWSSQLTNLMSKRSTHRCLLKQLEALPVPIHIKQKDGIRLDPPELDDDSTIQAALDASKMANLSPLKLHVSSPMIQPATPPLLPPPVPPWLSWSIGTTTYWWP